MTVYENIVKICKEELSVEVEGNDVNAKLIDVGLDSIALMTLIVFLEEEYGIEINVDPLVNVPYNQLTFDNVIQVVK